MKLLLSSCFLACYQFVYSQDTIVKINNVSISADVVEINKEYIKYIETEDPKKRLRSIHKSTVSYIVYSNKQIEHFPRVPRHPPMPTRRVKDEK